MRTRPRHAGPLPPPPPRALVPYAVDAMGCCASTPTASPPEGAHQKAAADINEIDVSNLDKGKAAPPKQEGGNSFRARRISDTSRRRVAVRYAVTRVAGVEAVAAA